MSDRLSPTAQPILITGGAGFIGSHLADALLAQGFAVRVLDDLSTGKRENLDGRVELIVGDVADEAALRGAVSGCQGVVHLAAIASVQASVEDPVGTHRANFIGTLNLCEAMRQEGIQRVLFASSAAVYGQNGEGSAIDEDVVKAPLTPYAADKLASEYYLDFYRREHGLEPAIFRFFNVYGPRQDPSSPYSGVISIFARRAEQGLPITVFGDGEQTRDFIYVGDLVKLLVTALLADEVAESAINVGLDQSTSLNQLLAEIGKLTGGLPDITYRPARHGDIRHSRADNRRLLQRYRLDAPTPLAEGLAQLITTRVS
ncbi:MULTISPECIES: NAD-dependent epimerase/dehydratase family protein [unclassified Pseudomonas]|uniref:NAD-dependent epimerase/dehydratase family protein n=1 Tax=unclassified Pseudomonas TaxID=196821 RepID=UPI001EFA99E9|nr:MULTISPECIES: NAD-dependent epimerase/dehydratase family protein [unclassified Pseudomonas]MCG8909165.1 NAD-dependent epimerase/dehydratase family protein [Pseudomonas sp. DP-17]MDU4250881.1 NAD-dependent epimerase/dehydratase family protein [Pseudomonas sp.]